MKLRNKWRITIKQGGMDPIRLTRNTLSQRKPTNTTPPRLPFGPSTYIRLIYPLFSYSLRAWSQEEAQLDITSPFFLSGLWWVKILQILARKITAWPFPTIEPYNTADNRGRQKKREIQTQRLILYRHFWMSYQLKLLRVDALETPCPPRSYLTIACALLILFILTAE